MSWGVAWEEQDDAREVMAAFHDMEMVAAMLGQPVEKVEQRAALGEVGLNEDETDVCPVCLTPREEGIPCDCNR